MSTLEAGVAVCGTLTLLVEGVPFFPTDVLAAAALLEAAAMCARKADRGIPCAPTDVPRLHFSGEGTLSARALGQRVPAHLLGRYFEIELCSMKAMAYLGTHVVGVDVIEVAAHSLCTAILVAPAHLSQDEGEVYRVLRNAALSRPDAELMARAVLR